MALAPLAARIQAATGLNISDARDLDKLSGIFNAYRHNGAGLENILDDQGIEGAVRARIGKVFDATAASYDPHDLYFVIRKFPPVDSEHAAAIVRDHLAGLAALASFVDDDEAEKTARRLKPAVGAARGGGKDEDAPVILYECLTDFLATMQPRKDAIFLLKEAIYSMANDYFLMAYMLWPAIEAQGAPPKALDPYFDIWSHGIKLDFRDDGTVVAALP
jgi:hypothetical protein